MWDGIRGRRLIREFLIVLRGTATLRTKKELAAGAKSLSQRGEPFFVRLPLPDD